MMSQLMFWPDAPTVSIVVLAAVFVVVLYLARTYAHHLIRSLTHVFHHVLRLGARSVMLGYQRLRQRNREVLLSTGAEAVEHKIEREFIRINNVVTRDLEAYPAMHRSMSDLVSRIDDDYRESTETPPPPPGWVDAVDAVAKIPATGDSMVSNILKEIKGSIDKHHKDALDEYRKQSKTRHGLLEKMMPYWRKASQTMQSMDKTIKGILERSVRIDNMMKEYEGIRAGTDQSVRTLSSSALTQFFISSVVMLIAMGGGVVNFNLIALPMSEMVGGGSYLGPFKMSQVAAMVIILVETTMGIFLMEALRITRLFPVIGNIADRKRKWFMWGAFSILFIMACVESSLAFMRDIIATERLALVQTLAESEGVASTTTSVIPMVGQMVLGFILPFALACVAVPFESFVHSGRTVIGIIVEGFLRFTAFFLRLAGNFAKGLGNLMLSIYDLLTFPLLWVEQVIKLKSSTKVQQRKGEEAKGGEIK